MNFNRELFALIKNKRLSFYSAVLVGVLISANTIILAYVLSHIIDSVFLKNKFLYDVDSFLIVFILLALLKLFLQWIEGILISSVVAFVKISIRAKIINRIFEKRSILLHCEQTGELANTILKGVDKLEDYFAKFLPQLFNATLVPILILFFVFPIDFLTAIIFIVTAPIIPLFMYLIGSAAQKLNNKQWQSLGRMSAYFYDVLVGMQTLKLFNKTKETIAKIKDVTDLFRIKTMNVLRVAFLSALVLEVAATISVAVVAVSIGLRLLSGNFNFADALFILIISPEFYLPMRKLGAGYHAGMEGVAAFERINEIIKIDSDKEKEKTKLQLQSFGGLASSIQFQNVSFSYPQREKKALDSISFFLEQNKTTAIVGSSGSGKSTIMNLLLGFLQPTEGVIYAGESNLSSFDIELWRKNVSWIPQDTHVFNKTIYENIRIANDLAGNEEIIEAAKKARLHKRILTLPNSYSSNIGEFGNNFSGGEIQRLAIARAHLRNTKYLFVDEPTAHLDPLTEQEILEDLFLLCKNKTTMIIAHRLNTIINADNIILLKDGEIINTGTHTELLLNNNYYKELVENYYA